MGCCVSTTTSSATPNSPVFKSKSNKKCSRKSLPSAQPLLEEETVKEVLSETPIIPKQPSPSIRKFQDNHQKETQTPVIKADLLAPDFSKAVYMKRQNETVLKKPYMVFNNEEISEEGLIVGASFSAEFTEKRENISDRVKDVKEVRQKPTAKFKNRSLSGEVKPDRAVKKSPVRMPESSPVRVGSGRESPAVYGRKKDSGEWSGRRSRSPVARTDSGPAITGLDRSQSSRRIGKSLDRVRSGLDERHRKLEEDDRDSKLPPTSNESLENPLVSLECFIFL
ncbi:Hypothetical predicted protein [Olea europaea subsp. europaea]|uniref:Uncharacterized protein n=1 Tax=Olea europaea subsp. europaea TaxID=158383 RepID=A0A8S0UDJ5_OLEEU|nr:Hypothetical predicted protein [Olea europaea subsp. europaea]